METKKSGIADYYMTIALRIGDRLRLERTARGMTQSTLAGSSITRNMLSRIENGSALPSLQTLVYLSARLGLSAGYFLAPEDDAVDYIKCHRIKEIRASLSASDYERSLKLCEGIKSDAEVDLIRALCHLNIAYSMYRAGWLATAAEHLHAASPYINENAYFKDQLKTIASVLELFVSSVTRKTPDADLLPPAAPADIYFYIKLLNLTDAHDKNAEMLLNAVPVLSGEKREHIRCRIALDSEDGNVRSDAASSLAALAENDISVFMKYRVFGDLENYFRDEDDYKNAYIYATRRKEIVELALT